MANRLTIAALAIRGAMASSVQVGTILMKEWPGMKQLLGLANEPSTGEWSVLKALDGHALDRKIHAAGWNFFFMAAEVKVMFIGAIETESIRKAVGRMLGKLKLMDF